ncbi:hypothetical protein AVEN_206930-1 [Araneus ventricosus]|uniref:DDE Tnp4 domain-containing protein n=1 Tax=Araneus ventricosus TaxID=182803 RepID=A0A4Y2PX53_ARAVE|nr:hypothetical protein AVEN_206930-1 [Araneus ventricosus]
MASQQNEMQIVAAASFIVMNQILKKKKRRERRWWITRLHQRRNVSALLNDLRSQESPGQFKNFVRMSSADFEKLIQLIAPKVAKKRYKISVSNSCCRKIGHNFTFFSDWELLQQFGLSDRCFQTVNLFHSYGCMQSTDSSSQKLHKASLKNSNFLAPYVIVADGAFTLNENIMKPYSHQFNKVQKRIFNYRLSRARRIVENVFGICSSTFRILRKPMLLHPQKAAIVSMTVTLLHNFLRASESSNSSYCPPGTFENDVNGEYVPGLWRKQGNGSLLSLQNVPRKMCHQRPSEGSQRNICRIFQWYWRSVPWQYKHL